MQDFWGVIIVLVIALTIGSFVTMISFRFATRSKKVGELILKRSFCPNCGNTLKIKSLIPIFSWLFQRGKCSFCSKKISIRYPLIELFLVITFLVIHLSTGKIFDAKLLLLFLIATSLSIMIITDLEHYFIPDTTQIALFILAVIYHLAIEDKYGFLYYFVSAALFLVFGLTLHYSFLFITKKHAIGVDDIKFFTIAGFLLGIHQFSPFMMISGGLGIIFGLIWQKITKDKTFPFAPALAVSLMICLLYQIPSLM